MVDPAAWYADDMIKRSDEWIYTLSGAEIDDLLIAVEAVKAQGTDIKDITRDGFPLAVMGPVLEIPVTDLFAAAFIDIGMVVHLSRVYGLPIARAEAGSLVKVIMAESAALMGTVWAVHFVSSALKVGNRRQPEPPPMSMSAGHW